MKTLEEKVLELKKFLRESEEQSYSMADFFRGEGDTVAFEQWRARWAVYNDILNIVMEM